MVPMVKLPNRRKGPMRPVTIKDVLWGILFFILLGVLVYFTHMADMNG